MQLGDPSPSYYILVIIVWPHAYLVQSYQYPCGETDSYKQDSDQSCADDHKDSLNTMGNWAVKLDSVVHQSLGLMIRLCYRRHLELVALGSRFSLWIASTAMCPLRYRVCLAILI